MLILQRWKLVVNNKVFEALLTDLSIAFYRLIHDIPISKLHSDGLSLTALRLVSDCLTNGQQRKKKDFFLLNGKTLTLYYKVLQGLIFVPLLFNIFVSDLPFNS